MTLNLSPTYPGQRPARDKILDEIIRASVTFWSQRGVDVSGVPLDVAEQVDRDGKVVGGVGMDKNTYGESRVVLNSRETGRKLKQIRNKRLSVRARRQQIMVLGQLVAHELGHTAGVGHSPTGVMSELVTDKNTPYEVTRLAKRLIKQQKRRKNAPVYSGEETF